MRDARERLRDILEAIEHIERYAAKGRSAFEADELIQSWFVRHLQIIGEAARGIPEEVSKQAPDIPWKDIIGMRHILVHDYFGINTGVVWGVIERDLPVLKRQILTLLRSLGG
ncbi:MAG: DUF86 domain-containing protein [Gammaproteobacteria bacterium]|nr:DUF86 domain-containing protein [Gammaproteobacteria bacterium]